MSGHDPKSPNNETPEIMEAEINALLDGELDQQGSEALKAAASRDAGLARAIVEAWELQKSMDELQPERAPASLTRKLKHIPRQQQAASRGALFTAPRWLLGGGLAAAAAVVLSLVLESGTGPVTPGVAPGSQQQASNTISDAQRAQRAAQDLQIAFYYLDKAGLRVSEEINQVLHDELAQPVKDNLSKHIPYSGQARKEKHA